MEPVSKKPSPRRLTEEDYAWAAGIGISRKRADFLASCPSNMRYGNAERPPKTIQRPVNPNRNMQKLGNLYYFRYRKGGKDIRETLGDTLEAARLRRDQLLAEHAITTQPNQRHCKA